MAETLLLASKALFAAVGCWLGLHLLQRARRPSGGLTLHGWASALICMGGLGLVGFAAGPSLAGHSAAAAHWLMLASDALERLSLLGLAVFVWHVFGGGGRARMVVLGAVLVAITAVWMLVIEVQRWPEPMLSLPLRLASQLSFAAPFVWSAAEAALVVGRRRHELDPLDASRALLWAFGSALFASICLASALGLLLPPASALGPALSVLRALLYTLSAAVVLLGFTPPAGYVRWVRGASERRRRPASARPAARRQRHALAPALALLRARRVV
jgi:hypothetical protein